MKLADKCILVTGGTSGIGLGATERLVAEGANVVFCGRNEERGQEISERLGTSCHFVCADVTKQDDIDNLVSQTVDRHGRIDCLFNNAAAAESTWLHNTTTDVLDKSMWSVFGSVVLMTQAVVREMEKQEKGCIINVGSSAGHRGNSSPPVYSALKAAISHLTRCFALELAHKNIRVNCISPGGIVTPLLGSALGVSDLDIVSQNLGRVIPVGRGGKLEDIASAVAYLASDEASYITGHDLVIDGGITCGLTPSGRVAERALIGAATDG